MSDEDRAKVAKLAPPPAKPAGQGAATTGTATTAAPAAPVDEGPILDADFIGRLGRLDIVSKKVFQGKIKGEKRSKRRGQSVEFADFRSYVAGDDLRFVDWNIYMRLDRLFLKLFLEEEDLFVYVLLDASKSMDYGSPTKFHYARKIAAALGYIALVNMNRIGIGAFSSKLGDVFAPTRGRRQLHRMVKYLEDLRCDGGTDLRESCRRFALEHPQRGVAVIVSDFLDRKGYEDAIKYFTARKLDVHLIQVLADEELDPPLVGDLRLVDQEDGDVTDITVSAPLLQRYRANVEAFIESIKQFCTRRGLGYVFTTTSRPFDQLILRYLRERGLLQ